MKKSSFTRQEHLKKNGLIRGVFDKGVPFKARLLNIYLLNRNNGSGVNRAAFIVQKRLCNKKSVLRNRFRRLLREAYRKTKHLLPPGHDVVLLAKALKKETSSTVVEKELENVFKKYSKK